MDRFEEWLKIFSDEMRELMYLHSKGKRSMHCENLESSSEEVPQLA